MRILQDMPLARRAARMKLRRIVQCVPLEHRREILRRREPQVERHLGDVPRLKQDSRSFDLLAQPVFRRRYADLPLETRLEPRFG